VRARNHLLDLFRIVFATLVLLSHAYEFSDGNRSRELFGRMTHSTMSFGEVGVTGFFLLSGYLIVQSWQHDPELLNYLRKRVLRIVPGYLVAALGSTVVVGLLVPGVPGFFKKLGLRYLASLILLSYPLTPLVFPGTTFKLVNGALWTIAYEFRCYILVAVLGACGLLRRRTLWLGLTVALLIAMTYPPLKLTHPPPARLELLFGRAYDDCRLTAAFLTGGCFFLFRDRVKFRLSIACVAAGLFIFIDILEPSAIEAAVTLCGSYLLFYFGSEYSHGLSWMRKVPDISYGIYLYGWPALGLLVWYVHAIPLVLFGLSVLICVALGWLSWHFVERPMLKLKRRATAPLPAA
jgi:peptidoglycan/LPS O-acetylase OafA/YrhL